MKRVFLIVLDSVGIGAAADAAAFGDEGCHTLASIAAHPDFSADTLTGIGLSHMDGLSFLPHGRAPLSAAVARLQERSGGKDTTIGHWELAGVVSRNPLPTYPNGFPRDLLEAFSARVGRGVLCNKPYSGTKVIADYGQQHTETGDLIVYTSADSVFQIAAHEEVVPPAELYRICKEARKLLVGEHAVGRVIARPFTGTPGHYTRTANRRDFSLVPPSPTMLDAIRADGQQVIAVGKITDIFAGRGITRSIRTHSNREGMEALDRLAAEPFSGLCFANLVDFDMLYGHRRDVAGYAAAFASFDRWLGGFLPKLGEQDCLIITADHGCDPAFTGTDHTREDVPLVIWGQRVAPVNLGTLDTFVYVAHTVEGLLGVSHTPPYDLTGQILR